LLLARALANIKRPDDSNEDTSAQMEQEQVRGAACRGVPRGGGLLLGGGGGSWALVFLVVEMVAVRLLKLPVGIVL